MADPALVQINFTSSSAAITSLPLAYSGSVVAGNTLIVHVSLVSNPKGTVTVTGTGAAFTQEVTTGDSTRYTGIWRAPNVTGGATTITCTLGSAIAGGGLLDLAIEEWSNVANSAIVTSSTGLSATGTTHDAGSVSPSAGACLVVTGCIPLANVATWTPTAPDVTVGVDDLRNFAEYRVTHATSSITPAWSTNVSTRCFGVVAVFAGTVTAFIAKPSYFVRTAIKRAATF